MKGIFGTGMEEGGGDCDIDEEISGNANVPLGVDNYSKEGSTLEQPTNWSIFLKKSGDVNKLS